jgi:hypothetical protein
MPTPTPFLFGGSGGSTKIYAFTMNNGDFIIGGGTSDTLLVSATTTLLPVPFISYIFSGGEVTAWAAYYTLSPQVASNVAAVSIRSSTIAFVLDISVLTIVIINSKDGSISSQYKDTSTYTGTVSPPLVNSGLLLSKCEYEDNNGCIFVNRVTPAGYTQNLILKVGYTSTYMAF